MERKEKMGKTMNNKQKIVCLEKKNVFTVTVRSFLMSLYIKTLSSLMPPPKLD